MESLANEVVGVYSVLLVLWLRDVHNWNIALNICLNGSRTAWLSQQNGTSRLSTVYTVGETETLLTCAPALSVAIVAVTRTTCTGVTSLCVYAVALRLWAADAWVYVTLVYVWKRQREEEREGERRERLWLIIFIVCLLMLCTLWFGRDRDRDSKSWYEQFLYSLYMHLNI